MLTDGAVRQFSGREFHSLDIRSGSDLISQSVRSSADCLDISSQSSGLRLHLTEYFSQSDRKTLANLPTSFKGMKLFAV